MATQSELAGHLDLSQQAVSKLKNAGVLPAPNGRRVYDLDAARIAYVRHLRGGASGRDSSRAGSLEAERARLASAQAEAQERKNAKERRELVDVNEINQNVLGLIALTKSQLGRVAAIVAKGDSVLRKRIDQAVNDALEDLSNTPVISADAFNADGADEDPEPN